MEAIDKEKYDEILWLREKNLTTCVVCPVWYRSKEDTYSLLKKVRFSKEELFDFFD